MTVVSYPTPPYSNPPIEPQYYAPWAFTISNVSLGINTIVTMIIPSITELNYVIGQEVKLLIPQGYGCRQLNNRTGFVIDITPPNQITLTINSSINVDPFVEGTGTTKPQILPIGDINNGTINQWGRACNGTFIPGSFIDISPF